MAWPDNLTIEEQQILLDGYSINEEYIAHV